MSVQDKVTVITGAGKGLGRVTALAFAQQGARVVCADQHQFAAEETRKLIAQAGGQAIAVRTDASQTPDVTNLIGQAESQFGGLDILISCVQAPSRKHAITASKVSDFDRVMAVNVRGPFLCTRAFLNALAKHDGHGRVITVSSMLALEPVQNESILAASQSALVGMMRTTALEMEKHHVSVNTICPRLPDEVPSTPLEDARSLVSRYAATPPQWNSTLVPAEVQLWPLNSVEATVAALLFLASESAGTVTGCTFDGEGHNA